jgi:type I restriction enzyme S subunit
MTRFVLPLLDDSWKALPLGKLAEIKYGSALTTTSRATDGVVPVYGSGTKVGTHDAYLHAERSIVIGRKGSVGSIVLTDGPFWCIDTAYYLAELSDVVDIEYLAMYLKSLDLSRLSISVGVPGLNREELAAVPVPLPAHSEQRRIVEVLRQVEHEVVRNQQLRRDQLDLMINGALERLVFAVDIADWASLGDVVKTRYGTSVSADATADYGTPVLRIPNVMGGEIDTTDMKYVELSSAELQRLCVAETDVLIVRSNGNPEYVGRSAPVTKDLTHSAMVYASYLIRLRTDATQLLPEYLSAFLNSTFGRLAMRNAIRTTAGQSNLSGENLTKVRLPIPDLAEQEKFRRFWLEVKALRQLIGESEDTAKELQNALSIYALSGDLTENWRRQNREEITAAAATRDTLLRERGSTIISTMAMNRVNFTDFAPPERRTDIPRPRRQALIDQLSSFQHEVWNMLRHEWRGAVLVDDPAVFEDFCTSQQTAWRLDGFDAAPINVRRALEQLAGMGLIRKFSLPQNDPSNETILYLTAFRPMREDKSGGRAEEDVALADASSVQAELRRREKGNT